MSAIFDRGTGTVIQPVNLHRQLEVRDIPFVFSTSQTIDLDSFSDYAGSILENIYMNISSYWMYTATIQLTLNSSEPSWSKDGWSFVPLDLSDLAAAKSLTSIGASAAEGAGSESQTNVTFETPAIRGRIECSELPEQVAMNLSNLYTPTDLRNGSIYNRSTIPDDVLGGFQLGNTYASYGYPGAITPILPSQNWTECPGCTSVFANLVQIICCGNRSSDSRVGGVAVGYWSPNDNLWEESPRWLQKNFTAKWIYGDAMTGIENNKNIELPEDVRSVGLLFPNPPSMNLLNCNPLVETANAKITVNPSSGQIQHFDILSTPSTVSEPWSDNYLPHKDKTISDLYSKAGLHDTTIQSGYVKYNVTLR